MRGLAIVRARGGALVNAGGIGDVPDVSAMMQAANTTSADTARKDALYGVAAKVATGGGMSIGDAESAVIGTAALMGPEVGAAMAVAMGFLSLVNATAGAAFRALGWDARGSTLADYEAHRCDNPPSDAEYQAALANLPPAPSGTPAGSFVAFAWPALARNAAAYNACRPAIDQWTLVGQLAQAYNNVRSGPQQTLFMGDVAPGVSAPRVQYVGFHNEPYYVVSDPLGRGTIEYDAQGNLVSRTQGTGFGLVNDVPYEIMNLAINTGPVDPKFLRPPYAPANNLGLSKRVQPLNVNTRLAPTAIGSSVVAAAKPAIGLPEVAAVGVGAAIVYVALNGLPRSLAKLLRR